MKRTPLIPNLADSIKVSSPQMAEIIALVTPSTPAVSAILQSVMTTSAKMGERVPKEPVSLVVM